MFNSAEILQHDKKLRHFAMKLTKNPTAAEDLLQDTILRALEKKHMFKEGSNLWSWMSAIMFNIFASKFRRSKKWDTQYDPEPYIMAVQVDSSQDEKTFFSQVIDKVINLSHDHLQIVFLTCMGCSYHDIAEKLNIAPGTVRSRLFRARQQIEEMTGEEKRTKRVQKINNVQRDVSKFHKATSARPYVAPEPVTQDPIDRLVHMMPEAMRPHLDEKMIQEAKQYVNEPVSVRGNNRARMTEEQAIEILTSMEKTGKIAKRLGIPYNTVYVCRQGGTFERLQHLNKHKVLQPKMDKEKVVE